MASPIYPQNSVSGSVTLDTANTSISAPGGGTIGTIYTGTSGGNDEIDTVYIAATGTTTAGMIRLWMYNGSIYTMVAEIPVPPNTPVNTFPQNPAWRTVVQFDPPLRFPSTSWVLMGTTHVSETFRVTAQGKKYA